MKLKNILLFTVLLGISSYQLVAQNQSPQVSNVVFNQRTDGSFFVDVYYDVNDPEGNVMTVSIQVSDNNGTTWDFSCNNITGDVGANITSGTGKHIEWDFESEHPQTFGDQFKIKIIADDGGIVMGIPCPGLSKVYYEGGPNNDTGGDYYNTVQIGDQCWLKENLNVGTRIDGGLEQTNNNTIEKYCYDNLESNCAAYGGFYLWDEAMQYATTPSSQGICPNGWHIPTSGDFGTLYSSVNNDNTALKAIGQGTGSGAGTNSSGFSALMTGLMVSYSSGGYGFGELGNGTSFWSSSTNDAISKIYIYFRNDDNYAGWGIIRPNFPQSIRCVKN